MTIKKFFPFTQAWWTYFLYVFALLGPVCVVCVAGPYRNGKSYILSEAFDQPDVFPLGHELLPETVGIWMWILPEEYEVTET